MSSDRETKTTHYFSVCHKISKFWDFYWFGNSSTVPLPATRHTIKLHIDLDESDYCSANINNIIAVIIRLRQQLGKKCPVLEFKFCPDSAAARAYDYDYLNHAQFTIYFNHTSTNEEIAQFIVYLNILLQQLNIKYSTARNDCMPLATLTTQQQNGISLRHDTHSSTEINATELPEIAPAIIYIIVGSWFSKISDVSSISEALQLCTINIDETLNKYLTTSQQKQLLESKVLAEITAKISKELESIKKTIMEAFIKTLLELNTPPNAAQLQETLRKLLSTYFEKSLKARDTARIELFMKSQESSDSLFAKIKQHHERIQKDYADFITIWTGGSDKTLREKVIAILQTYKVPTSSLARNFKPQISELIESLTKLDNDQAVYKHLESLGNLAKQDAQILQIQRFFNLFLLPSNITIPSTVQATNTLSNQAST